MGIPFFNLLINQTISNLPHPSEQIFDNSIVICYTFRSPESSKTNTRKEDEHGLPLETGAD